MLYPIVLGTAGHIDHGKTALVRALTGIDTDRLPVEKARGITTELGFARLDLGGRRIAVVDVPGHERFVKSMVAGATGLDLVCLAIAADEGVMPQTREHLEICELLGVRRGIIALTKRDLVDEEWLALVVGEVRAATAGTRFADAPLIACSSRTGEGLDELRGAIAGAVDALPPRAATGVFRLPIDRAFTIKGFGTVVTGTVLGGEVAVDDEVAIVDARGDRVARVRGIEVHGDAVARAVAGHRAALNLGGLALDQLARGDVLAHPGQVAGSHILDVELRYLASAPGPLAPRSTVLVHHGTTQRLARLALIDRSAALAPGESALAQLRLDAREPLAALPGDAFLLRGFVATATHGATIGGGRALRVQAPRARAAHADTVAQLTHATTSTRIALEARGAALVGIAVPELVRRLGVPAAGLAAPLDALVASGELLAVPAPAAAPHYLHAGAVAQLEARIVDALARATAEAPDAGREALRSQLPAALPPRAFDLVLAGLARQQRLVVDGDRVRRPVAAPPPQLDTGEAALLARFAAWGLAPLRPAELPAALSTTTAWLKPRLDRLLATRLLTKVKPDLYIHSAAVATLRDKLRAFLDAHGGTIDTAQWKELAGVSRKYSIPLAEFFDGERLTVRAGDLRRKR